MRPRERRDTGQTDLFRARLDQILDLNHPLVKLAHTIDWGFLAMVIPDLERTIGAELERVVTDAGYKGHHAPQERPFRVYVAGQKRGLTVAIKRAFRRRAAVEPVIGHLKTEHRLGRNHLIGLASV